MPLLARRRTAATCAGLGGGTLGGGKPTGPVFASPSCLVSRITSSMSFGGPPRPRMIRSVPDEGCLGAGRKVTLFFWR